MNRQKSVIWANLLVSGLLLTTISACNNDEPAASSTPTSSSAAAPEAAPIAGATPDASPSPSASSPVKDSAKDKEKDKSKEKDKPQDTTTVATAPKPLAASKPLVAGEVKPDKPLPPKDIEAKPVPETPKPALVQGGLSESQMKTMKTMLDDAKKAADTGSVDDAVSKFNEFFGPWDEAAKELKTKAADKHGAIETAIKVADEAGKAKDKAKLSKAIADLLVAVEKAKK
jgi:flagellum-specific peptidoglycan hydrolase FlgJ